MFFLLNYASYFFLNYTYYFIIVKIKCVELLNKPPYSRVSILLYIYELIGVQKNIDNNADKHY